MQRDGYSKSLWQTTTGPIPTTSGPLTQDIVDVVIVGAGITGLSTGLALQQAGMKCLILEAHTIGFGTTGGTSAHINTFVDLSYDRMITKHGKENALLVSGAALEAAGRIRQWAKEYAPDCNWQPQDAYMYATTDKQVDELESIVEGSRSVGMDASMVEKMPPYFPFLKAARFGGQASFHPTRYLMGIAGAFRKAGGSLHEHCTVLEVDTADSDALTVHTSNGAVRAKHLIYATHIPPGVNILHFRAAPYRSYVLAATLKKGAEPLGALVYDMEDPYYYYRMEEVDGVNLLVAGGCDHKTAEGDERGHARTLEAHVRSLFPVEEITHQWSSQYFEPTDGLPYIGKLPMSDDRIMVATGYSGNGITHGTVASILLTDLLVKGESPYQKVFNPARVSPVAGFANFVKEAVDVVGHLVAAPFPEEKLGSLGDIARGEGKVVQHDGHAVGLFRDEEGQLHGVSPACSHIKCTVAWNATERSWDCPCHGSRFGSDGVVLTAPARKPLQRVSIVGGKVITE
ncbi:MAG: FAD-dependent oxidoreductase [Flavobacteriales bacterium]